PAQEPRPTSSIPTTTSWPVAHSSRSTSREGDFRLMALRSCGTVAVTSSCQAHARSTDLHRADHSESVELVDDSGIDGREQPSRRLRVDELDGFTMVGT